MALVHQKLYKSKNLSIISLNDYVTDLCHSLNANYSRPNFSLEFKIDSEDINADLDLSLSLGLVLNELILNSIKHAFLGLPSGIISLSLHKVDRQPTERQGISIVVRDNGLGFPSGFDPKTQGHMGMLTIIALIQDQLHGSVHFFNEGGSVCHIKV